MYKVFGCDHGWKYGEGYDNELWEIENFKGHDFRRWQKKMHLLLIILKVVYVLTTLMPVLIKDDETVEAIMICAKWENEDYMCIGHILNGMSDSLFDVYTNVKSAKELWDSLESKYMAKDSSSNKFLEFLRAQDSDNGKGKEVDGPSVNITKEGKTRPVTQKGIAKVVIRRTQMLVIQERGRRTIPKTKVDAIAWWINSGATINACKDRCSFNTFKPMEDEYVLYRGDDHFAHVHGKGNVVLEFSSGKSITLFTVLVVELLLGYLIRKGKVWVKKGIDCIFAGYAEHSKAYMFYVIEPNKSISINSIIESRNAIFDENNLSLISKPRDIMPNREESQRDDHFDDVPNEILEPRKGKRVQKAKSYGFDFQLYLVEGSRDQVGSQHSYCYSIEEDPRTYNKAMQSRIAAF
uniref:Zinc finger, CCHC-type n=1 Tax=Tanacetum cinerariifolium TaxID=118510 RepID=A0A6L2LXG6_TANCI|nr:zinc finger, CCHC-type [Tanacetum cinerariifolium]